MDYYTSVITLLSSTSDHCEDMKLFTTCPLIVVMYPSAKLISLLSILLLFSWLWPSSYS